MATKAQWDQWLIDIDQWQKVTLASYVNTVKSFVLSHHNDPPSTEIGGPGSNPPPNYPPPPPSS